MAFRFLAYEVMDLDAFRALPDAPIQRNTKERAPKAGREHLRTPQEIQHHVDVALYPDPATGAPVSCKVDGHTRAELWRLWEETFGAEGLQPPADGTLNVRRWACDSAEDAKALYRCIDNPAAAEKANDVVFGALRALDFHAKSTLFEQARVSSALKIALGVLRDTRHSRNLSAAEAVEVFAPEIRALDLMRLHPGSTNMARLSSRSVTAGTLAAVLLILRKYRPEGASQAELDVWAEGGVPTADPRRAAKELAAERWLLALEFLRRVANRHGREEEGRMDGVQALLKLVEGLRKAGKTGGGRSQGEILAKTLSAAVEWIETQVAARAEGLAVAPLERGSTSNINKTDPVVWFAAEKPRPARLAKRRAAEERAARKVAQIRAAPAGAR